MPEATTTPPECGRPTFDLGCQQWQQFIGYWLNRDGKRVRRRFYFGKDEHLAIAESAKQQQRWNEQVEHYNELICHPDSMYALFYATYFPAACSEPDRAEGTSDK